MNIFSKGMLVVLIPLAGWLVFISGLLFLQNGLETAVAENNRSKEVLVKLGDIGRAAMQLADSVVWLGFDKSDKARSRVDQWRRTMVDRFEETRELAASNQTQRNNIAALEKDLKEIADLSEALERSLLGKGSSLLLAQSHLTSTSKKIATKLAADCEAIAKEETLVNQQSDDRSRQFRQLVTFWLLVGIAINILVSLLFAVFFTRNITNRLRTVVENVHLFGIGAPLHDALAGVDEISQLDHGFHDMANALSQALRKERILVDKAADVIFALDEKLTFQRINSACERLWHYNADQLIGRSIEMLAPETYREQLVFLIQRATNSEESISVFECEIKNGIGELAFNQLAVHWSAADTAYLCVARDVTERTREAQRKSDFINMLSHDIRNPLFSVTSFLEMSEAGVYGELSANGQESVRAMRFTLKHLQTLLEDLLDIEKMEAGKLEISPVLLSIDDVVGDAVDLASGYSQQQRVDVRQELTGGLKVMGDRRRLVQVIHNLISNAVRFSPAGSVVTVKTVRDGESAKVSVTDEGPGIAESVRLKIFDSFWQGEGSSANRSGAGLGLSICKSLMQLHGGQIGVESSPSGGASFWINLPAVNDSVCVDAAG